MELRACQYVSPFWTTYFFDYLDYSPQLERLSYREFVATLNRAALEKIVQGSYSETGRRYADLIRTFGAPRVIEVDSESSLGVFSGSDTLRSIDLGQRPSQR